MKRGWMRGWGWAVAVAALTLTAWPARVSAQQTQQREVECRCIDADGDPIENCTCFRMPRFEMAIAPFAPRPRLGISVDPAQGSSYDAQGARVTRVLEDGPAAAAGLREGDVITAIHGRSLLQPLAADVEEDFDLDESLPVQRLLSIARGLEAGEQVQIEYLREGERRTASVEARELSPESFAWAFDTDKIRIDAERMRADAERLREQMRELRLEWSPDAPDAPRMRIFGDGDGPLVIGPVGSRRYGIQLIELNEGLGAYFGTSQGVLVTEVDEDSTLGLRAGDVILRIGERDVTTPSRALRLLGTYGEDEDIHFRVRRNGTEVSVMGRLDG